ncbi:hypothetical protein XENOCAPTIV_018280, partial [Xenoophorus captivus]
SESQLNASSLKEALERFNHSRTPSASSRSSRKSSHTAVSDPACEHHLHCCLSSLNISKRMSFCLSDDISISASQIRIQGDRSTPGRQSVSAHLKEQLEKKTRMIEDNIQQQLDELRQIQVELQSVQGQTPQLLTKLVTGQIPCGAVMVPTTMFMGQVVTAFAPQQGQTQAISISQQQQQVQGQSQVSALQAGRAQLAPQQPQFLQV